MFKNTSLLTAAVAAGFSAPAALAAPITVSSVGTYADTTTLNGDIDADAPGNSSTAAAFTSAVAAAFAADTGGVFNADSEGFLSGVDTINVEYGTSGSKTLVITPSENIELAGFGSVDESSGNFFFIDNDRNDSGFSFDLALSGASPLEGVLEIGVVALSRSSNSAADNRSVTANFSGGGSVTLTDEILTGNGTDNTFFSIAAPTGESITSVDFSGTGLSGGGNIGGFDDFGFVTGVIPEPASGVLCLVGMGVMAMRRRR
ncbi:MAG: PEP-CTERM sorting domain-containing protein [Planctomycetota bacterium]